MAHEPPHVLILPSWYPTRHSPEEGCYFREQAHALGRIGLRVGVAYPDLRSLRTTRRGRLNESRLQVSHENDQGIATLRWHGWNPPKLPRLRRMIWLAQAARLVDRYVAEFGRPDLIHAHSASWAGSAAHAAAGRLDMPYVVTEHSSYYARGLVRGWQVPHIRVVFRGAARTLAVSRAVRDQIAAYIPPATVPVVPNGVDTAFFCPPGESRTTRPFRILTVALLNANKSVDVLLRAFAEMARERPGPVLEIGGDGPERASLQALVGHLGIEGRVAFLGQLSREEVRQAMGRANVFVLPSRIETFGIVLVEAMATGLPVIATRAGGPREIVRPEVGVLTRPGDAAQLARTLTAFHDDYDAWRARSEYIRAYAVAAFDHLAIAARVHEIYRDVLGWTANRAGARRPRRCAS